MKLRFGIDAAASPQIEARLAALSDAPPAGRRLAYVYLDTPEDELAARGVALRFRRSGPLDAPAGLQPWARQVIWAKDAERTATSLKKLGIARLKERLDATFTVRIERWTWQPRDDWATVSLDRTDVSTGAAREQFHELRIVCKRKRAEDAMHLAVELGAMHLTSVRARDRGRALLARI